MKKITSDKLLAVFRTTILLVVFFIALPLQAQENSLIKYFLYSYNSNKNSNHQENTGEKTSFGTINWLPGGEFEILIPADNNRKELVPTDKTPDFIKENINKKIEKLQQPTAEELKQPIEAEVIEHNLPIAVLNVWRPYTIIKIKNQTDFTWKKNKTMLLSENTVSQPSFFRDQSWLGIKKITYMNEPEIKPGQTATFEFLIDGRGKPGLYYHVYKLQVNNQILHLGAKGNLPWLTRVDAYHD